MESLLTKPKVVAHIIQVITQSVSIPVSIKTRLGILNKVQYPQLIAFIEEQVAVGVKIFYLHARQAILDKRFDSQYNREVPPIDYEAIYKIKNKYPHLTLIINGGINNIEIAQKLFSDFDGIMIGRAAIEDPTFFAKLARSLLNKSNNNDSLNNRFRILELYLSSSLIKDNLYNDNEKKLLLLAIKNLFNNTVFASSWEHLYNKLLLYTSNTFIDNALSLVWEARYAALKNRY